MHAIAMTKPVAALIAALALMFGGLALATTDVADSFVPAAEAGNHPNWNNLQIGQCNAQHRHFYTPFATTVYQGNTISNKCFSMGLAARHGAYYTYYKTISAGGGLPSNSVVEWVFSGQPGNANSYLQVQNLGGGAVAEAYHA